MPVNDRTFHTKCRLKEMPACLWRRSRLRVRLRTSMGSRRRSAPSSSSESKAQSVTASSWRRYLSRSKTAEQLTRALTQIAALPATPALRREHIELQVALITPLIHVKGFAAPETKAAVQQARLLIEQAETLGEPPEDPLLLFSVLYGVWAAHFIAFNGDALRELAVQFLALAEKQRATVPLEHVSAGLNWGIPLKL